MQIYRTMIFLFCTVVLYVIASGLQAEEASASNSTVETSSKVALERKGPTEALEVSPAIEPIEQSRVQAIQKAIKSTVGVFGPRGQGGGSGVVISPDGYTLTNYHVVEGCGEFMKCSMPDGVLYDAVIVGIDPTGDVALVKLLGREDFPTATIADSDDVQIGDWCFAIGNPFLLATNFQPSVSMGIISGKNRYQYPSGTLLEYADCLQTDAAINPGNSGGALFNADGDLVGINGRGSFEKRGRVNVGVGYAISINQIMYFLDHLKSGRLVDHATLGATVESDSEGVVRVNDVLPTSDAFRRGLRYDDVIVSFAGRKISTVNQFKNVLGVLPKGFTPEIVYERDGEQVSIVVRLAGVHASGRLTEIIEGKPLQQPVVPGMPPAQDPENPGKDEEKDDEKDEEKVGDDQALEAQQQHPYHHLHIKRSGFSNYYFNQLNRDRIWQRFTEAGGSWHQQPGRWRIVGRIRDSQTADETTFQLMLGDQKSGIRIGDSSFVLDPAEDLSQQLVPPNTGGLLVALHLWRAMLVEGPQRFGDVYYFGGLPARASTAATRGMSADETVEVLIATRGGTETHFRFNRKTALLQGTEMFPEINSDPCRLSFLDFQRDGDLLVPRQIQFDAGFGSVKSVFVIERIEFLKKRIQESTQ